MTEPELTIVTKLLELAQADPRYLQQLESLRQMVIVMFTDIQGSTAYFEEHGDAAGLLMVRNCNRTIRQVVEKHQGRVIKNIGDGMMITFTESAAAVEAAIEFQKVLAEINELRSETERIGVRVGVHEGAGIIKSNDVFGDVVNMASRVESEAAPGQIVISDALHKHLPEDRFDIRELGRFQLKGKTNEHTLYQVLWTPEKTQPSSAEAMEEFSKSHSRFRIQLMKQDGSLGPQNPIMPQLTIGRTQGDLRFSTDANMAPLNARVFVQEGQLFIEDLSEGREKVFVRLTGGHTLQMGDIVIMGQQVFCFREKVGAMSAVTMLGATLNDIRNALDDSVAELVCIDPQGRSSGQFPISWVETQFGRTHGRYTFPNDRMMSGNHARILQRGEDFLLEDAGSRNGTLVSVRTKTALVDGSTVLVGSQLFRIQS